MSDISKLIERIDALEMRVAYQDDTIEKLNAVVTSQWAQIDALKRQLAALSERLDEAAAAGPRDPLSEKPPHY
jgi:SlyX protein